METPHLENFKEFEEILSQYKPSKEAVDLLNKAKLVILQSMAAGGRNTIIKKLEESGLYQFFPSDTTRPPRKNKGIMEQSGVEYFFITEDQFMEGLKNGEYLEAEIIHNQQVSGISTRELKKISQSGKIGINEVGRLGAENIHNMSDKPFIIFIVPPSYDEWMDRWNKRGSVSKEEFKNRMESAQKELRAAVERDYFKFIINDKLEDAVFDIRKLVERDEYSKEEANKAREIAKEILKRVDLELIGL